MPAVETEAAPVTVSQYVLKVHSRCDLACDHCYVYEHADQSWRTKPRTISPPTAELTARRIAEHAATHDLPQVHVVLHGGEPLLLGREAMRGVLATLAARISPVTRLSIRIHTNGVQLDEQWCELFDEYAVMVGVSLDGDRAANDRHRRFADGRSSHARCCERSSCCVGRSSGTSTPASCAPSIWPTIRSPPIAPSSRSGHLG